MAPPGKEEDRENDKEFMTPRLCLFPVVLSLQTVLNLSAPSISWKFEQKTTKSLANSTSVVNTT
jgi:hypothetical protein